MKLKTIIAITCCSFIQSLALSQQITNSYFLVNGGYTNYSDNVNTSCYPILSVNSEWGLGPKQIITTGYGGGFMEMFTKISSWSRQNTNGGYDSSNYIAVGENGNSYTPGNLLINGDVGIGTTSPGSFKLAVEGNIGARKVVITKTNPFPDYVFNDDYKLQTLSQVEQFIKTNKHLPGIPTANEVEKNGLDIGENQTMLLKKIEELTLYLIEIKKENEDTKN